MELVLIDNAEVLIAKINTAHAEAQAYAGKAIERALEAGDLLLLAKGQVDHGQWQSWLKQHCPAISVRTAQNYMKVAKELPVEKRSDAHLTVREALRLVGGEGDAPTTKANEPQIDFLPKLGEMALFVDDDWEYMHSSKHPNYYHLMRWFVDNDDNNGESNKKIPCAIFRRPMNAEGIDMYLRKWKVLDEQWELLGYPDVNAAVVEEMSNSAEREFQNRNKLKLAA